MVLLRTPARPSRLTAALTTLAAALAAPAAGHAAAVKLDHTPGGAEYTAAPGETNALVVSSARAAPGSPDLRWTFRDTGAAITPGPGCAAVDAHTVTCAVPAARAPEVHLGDGDDTFEGDTSVAVYGEAGNDTLRLADGDDPTTGTLDGGAGDDLLDASVASAVLLVGGSGGDLLTGSDRDDTLQGGPGDDELRGGQGNDVLEPGGGTDRVSCGAGSGDAARLDASDRLLDPSSPTLSLGGSRYALALSRQLTEPGDDSGPTRTQLRTDCENLGFAAAKASYRVDVWKSPAKLVGTTLWLGRRTSSARSGRLELRSPQGALLGSGSMRLRVLRVHLTPAGAKLLLPGRRATVKVLTTPLGSRASGTRGDGVEVDLTIAKS